MTRSSLVNSGCKTYEEVASNSTSWGNYSDDTFSPNARGNYTGVYEQAKANNIYDLAGNNWEWTQERCGSNYVMRSGGYNLMVPAVATPQPYAILCPATITIPMSVSAQDSFSCRLQERTTSLPVSNS